ncbi:uncharacterized protein METZ01_LOCUS141659 [marine metagenome]|uniref:Uncharacterized protein n=1 Tax=marine metagenome TaxID=408172 RepID=A0A381ZHQ9_9ZZZZ
MIFQAVGPGELTGNTAWYMKSGKVASESWHAVIIIKNIFNRKYY